MPVDRNTSRRGVGWIKLILGGFIVLVLAIPLLMGISGLRNEQRTEQTRTGDPEAVTTDEDTAATPPAGDAVETTGSTADPVDGDRTPSAESGSTDGTANATDPATGSDFQAPAATDTDPSP